MIKLTPEQIKRNLDLARTYLALVTEVEQEKFLQKYIPRVLQSVSVLQRYVRVVNRFTRLRYLLDQLIDLRVPIDSLVTLASIQSPYTDKQIEDFRRQIAAKTSPGTIPSTRMCQAILQAMRQENLEEEGYVQSTLIEEIPPVSDTQYRAVLDMIAQTCQTLSQQIEQLLGKKSCTS